MFRLVIIISLNIQKFMLFVAILPAFVFLLEIEEPKNKCTVTNININVNIS